MHDGFMGLGLMPELVRAVGDEGWLLPYDVQDESIPLILGGGDVMVAAETGSGKTGAFALPIIQICHEIRRGELESAGTKTQAAKPATVGPVQLSDVDRSATTVVSASRYQCECRQQSAWGGVRANVGALRGKYYYEAYIRDEGICRVGWSTIAGNMDLGTDLHGYGYGGTAKKANKRKFENYGKRFSKGDTIGCLLDMDGKTVAFTHNGADQGKAYDLPRALQGPLYPAMCMKNSCIAVNFGIEAFRHPPPSGYIGLTAAAPTNVMSSADNAASARKIKKGKPLAVVLEPAKDLAEQVFKSIGALKKYVTSPAISQILVMGGLDTKKIARQARAGCDVVVGTPGMIAKFVESGDLDLSSVRLFVLDEADQLVEEDNLPTIMKIYNALPKGLGLAGASRLQVAFFSATLHSPSITQLSTAICQHPTWVDLKGKDSVPDTVHHVVINVDPRDSELARMAQSLAKCDVPTDGVHARDARSGGAATASETIKKLKPALLLKVIQDLRMDQALIFCRTNVDCNNLEKFLVALGGGRSFRGQMESGKENPYSCCVLAGMRSMGERRDNLRAFKEGHVRFLICTDVAARGIDISELPYVVNMTLPDAPEQYIHRIGRVGRADRMGLAVSIVAGGKEKVWYHRCKNRGRGCTNTKLLEKGGCTIWYDEVDCLRQIEKRLGDGIARMGRASGKFQLPEAMRGVTYGEVAVETAETSDHVRSIRGIVEELAFLEGEAQSTFWTLQRRFHGKARAGAATGAAAAGELEATDVEGDGDVEMTPDAAEAAGAGAGSGAGAGASA